MKIILIKYGELTTKKDNICGENHNQRQYNNDS